MRIWLLLVVGSILLNSSTASAAEPPQLWLYYPVNLLPDKNVETLEPIWRRAAAAGYTHVLLADSKFCRLGELPPEYFKNCQRVKKIAADLKLEIVPALFPVGYANDLLWHDPNLAEGLPVKDSLFVVKAGEARLVPDPPVSLQRAAFKDDSVTIDSSGVVSMPGVPVHTRLCYQLKLPPFRCYHVSAKIKTQDFTGHPQIQPLANGNALNFKSLGVKPTQDWTQADIVFNTLGNQEVTLYFGVWEDTKGLLQWKDLKIEEVGLLNVLRREGAPCVLKREDGKPAVEGKDYEHIQDPRMGSVPWAGEYEAWHEPPAIKTPLPDGVRLRVSWYHPVIIYDEQVCGCISDPRMNELLADQARRMKELWRAAGYMMSHDEFRVCNWDEACERRHLTPGEMLAQNVKMCTQLVHPQTAYVWSDMFDPFHNAVKGPYYLVNGPWTGSWEGLEKDVVVMNWNFGKRGDSLKWFADRGHRQIIAGYYDADLSDLRAWIESAGPVKGVAGYMYTTWQNNYSQLEAFAKTVRG